MAELITGLQGSGKSYYAMHRIYNDKEKYDKVMTDIDGLTAFENIYALDFPSFVQKVLMPCYELMVKDINAMEDVDNLTDEEIFSLITTNESSFQNAIEYLQRIYVLSPNADEDNRLLLIIDESQNYFGKTVKLNAYLLWFITQHRHLYMEVYLITQDHSLIRPDYKLFNIIYRALPPAKQVVSGSIIYNEYCGFPLKDNFVKKLMLKKDSKIFDMYVSGDKVESPNIFRRYIIMLVIMVSIILYGVYYFYDEFIPSEPNKNHIQKKEIRSTPNTNSSNSSNKPNEVIYEDETDNKFYTFVVFEDRFYIQGLAGDDYPLKLLLYIKEHYFKTVVEKIKRDDYHTVIYAICDNHIENLFQAQKEDKIFNDGVNKMTSFN